MIKKLLLTTAILGAMAVPASAQFGLHLAYGKHRGKSGFQVTANLGNVVRLGVAKGVRHDEGRHDKGRHNGRYDKGHGKRRGHRVHYHTVTEKVWVPGVCRRVYVPARYGYRSDSCGRRIRYCIAPAHYEFVQEPGHWVFQQRQVRVRH